MTRNSCAILSAKNMKLPAVQTEVTPNITVERDAPQAALPLTSMLAED